MKVVVCEVYEYEAADKEISDVTITLQRAVSHYEHPHFIVTAPSLDDLPHPMQVGEIRKAFGS